MQIYHKDFRRAGYCNRGLRDWCVRHGFDWFELRRLGLDAEALIATGDPRAAALVPQAEQWRAEETVGEADGQ